MPKHDPNARTALYRLLAANGRLLYVGIAANPDSRWGQHSTNQQWWDDVADRKIEWFPNRAAAAAAEVAAIKTERPLHNIQHAVIDKPVIPTRTDKDVIGRMLEIRSNAASSGVLLAAQTDRDDRLPFDRNWSPGALHDMEAEGRLIGSMLRSKRAIRDARSIAESADLYRPGSQLIWNAAVHLDDAGELADPITVAAELVKRGEIMRVGGPSHLHSLHSTVVSSSNAAHYATIVRTLAITRRWAEAQAKLKR